jgi:gliding motility-associated-like protein
MNAVFYHTSPDKSAMSGYVWDFGDGTGSVPGDANYASHLYLNPGVYSVTLTTIDSFGCSYSTTKTSYVKVNGSLANFTSATNAGCKGMTTSFTDGSTTSPGNSIVKWTFDFGDSTVQTFTAPPFQHQYDSVGDYDVKLIVEDASGCKDSVIKREFVKVSSAKADYSIDGPSCPGSPVFFSNFSKSDLPLTYDWSFGDGLSSDEKNPAHSYADTGLYTVKLRVTDAVGCSDSAVFVDYVHIALPKADFTANNFISYCTPFEAKFINQTYFLKSSSWDLANATSNAKDPANYYTATGQYKITLYATSPGGCRDSISKYLDIYDPNDATIDYDSATGCRPKTVNFSAFKPMNATFIWDFGDGNVIDTTSNVISHVYENFGNFIPKVILKQPEGCVVPVTGSETVKIYGAKVQFGVDRYLFCDTGTPNIIDTTVYAGSITKYSWDFGDGTQSNQPLPSHTYVTPGSYNIKLTVESEGGCLDSMTLAQPVKIVQSPDIVLSGDVEICTNERVQLSAALSRPDTSNISWQWQFPNGQTYTSQNPPLQSYPPGTYQVSVIATNSSGCFDNASTTLQVHSLPNITMPESITKQVGVPITIPAQYSSGTRSYYWSPGNSLDCNSCPQPVSSTKFNTDYTVSILDSNGCADQDTIRVVVVCEGATIFFPNAFSPNGDGSNDVFIVRGNGLDRVKSIRMFNRWGEVVYERKDFPVNNASYGWDGKVKGGKPQPGVYIYQAEVFCENGEVIRFEGNVALIQ